MYVLVSKNCCGRCCSLINRSLITQLQDSIVLTEPSSFLQVEFGEDQKMTLLPLWVEVEWDLGTEWIPPPSDSLWTLQVLGLRVRLTFWLVMSLLIFYEEEGDVEGWCNHFRTYVIKENGPCSTRRKFFSNVPFNFFFFCKLLCVIRTFGLSLQPTTVSTTLSWPLNFIDTIYTILWMSYFIRRMYLSTH